MQRPTGQRAAVFEFPYPVGDKVETGSVSGFAHRFDPIIVNVNAMGDVHRFQFQDDPVALVDLDYGRLEGEATRLQSQMVLGRLSRVERERGKEHHASQADKHDDKDQLAQRSSLHCSTGSVSVGWPNRL